MICLKKEVGCPLRVKLQIWHNRENTNYRFIDRDKYPGKRKKALKSIADGYIIPARCNKQPPCQKSHYCDTIYII